MFKLVETFVMNQSSKKNVLFVDSKNYVEVLETSYMHPIEIAWTNFKGKKCQFTAFLWWILIGNQNIYKDFKIFLLSYLVCNQIWLSYFVNDRHFC